MTLTAQPRPALQSAPRPVLRPRSVTWSKVDTDFHVASRAGEFVGSIDMTADQRYVAFDAMSSAIGIFPSLERAKAAVREWVPDVEAQRERRLAERLRPLSAAAGLMAGTAALFAAMVTLVP